MKFANKILKLSTLIIALLITLPMAIQFRTVGKPEMNLLFFLLNKFGQLTYFIWLFSIAIKGTELLKFSNIETKQFNYLKYLVIAVYFLELLLEFLNLGEIKIYAPVVTISLQKPLIIALTNAALTLWALVLTARLICIIENNKNVSINRSILTFVLLLIPYVGILFVHYRVKDTIGKTIQ